MQRLLDRWQRRVDFWARAERENPAPSHARSAARANQSTYTACIHDLRAVLQGQPIPERVGD